MGLMMAKNSFAVLALGIMVLLAMVARCARNPYGLEPERLGPKRKKLAHPVTAIADAENYLLYPYTEDSNYVIHIALPNHYIHPENTSKKLFSSYGMSAEMYYPGLNGKFHPENANLPQCNGYCNGYVSASIEPNPRNAQAIMLDRLEYFSRARQSKDPALAFEDLEPELGFDERLMVKYPIADRQSPSETSTKIFFIKREKDGALKYVFECSPNEPSPACSVMFNLSSRPELLVDIRFGMHLMTEWENLVRSVDAKITSWGAISKIETVTQ